MKFRILTLCMVLLAMHTQAQTKTPATKSPATKTSTAVKVVPKTPAGFVKLASASGKTQTVYVMIEPVSLIDFREFITVLYTQNRIMDANSCMAAIPKDMDPKSKYIVLSNPAPLQLYAKYLANKLSVDGNVYEGKPMNAQTWKLMKAPADGQAPKVKNNYGFKFFSPYYEWKLNEKGVAKAFTDINGYTRANFRIMLIQTNPL